MHEKLEPEDVLQDAYLAASKRFSELDYCTDGAFVRWMCRIIDNRLRDLASLSLRAWRASEQWPTEITVGSDPITLPPIVLRKLARISIKTPQASAPMNLTTDRITWSAVAGATQYRIHFGSFSDKPHPTSNWFVMESTTRNELTLSESSQATLRAASEHWKRGTRGGIRIEAFNADMHRIGTTVGDHPFLIADELQPQ